MSGAWCFRGARIPIAALFENLDAGASVSDFVEWFPGVTVEQVQAVPEHARAARCRSRRTKPDACLCGEASLTFSGPGCYSGPSYDIGWQHAGRDGLLPHSACISR